MLHRWPLFADGMLAPTVFKYSHKLVPVLPSTPTLALAAAAKRDHDILLPLGGAERADRSHLPVESAGSGVEEGAAQAIAEVVLDGRWFASRKGDCVVEGFSET